MRAMLTLKHVKERIKGDPRNWRVYLMDFVDDFRHYRDLQMIEEPFDLDDERFDALLAATAEQLCNELSIKTPVWILRVPAPRDPWFVSEMDSLKAIAIVESPLPFRLRKLFVLENFLSRV
jgi:hypothetical protein